MVHYPTFTKFLADWVLHFCSACFISRKWIFLRVSPASTDGALGSSYIRTSICSKWSKSQRCRHREGDRPSGERSADCRAHAAWTRLCWGENGQLVSTLGTMKIPWVLGLSKMQQIKRKPKRCIILKSI